ncbi:MAG: PspC domain-containing protein, partial [Cyclobacteriaceae bacterium]|nr:PspC domain-containing protein [Cyclobacteriaceae bacterium]
MKKNISINISGIIFHIEEDGYEKLKLYLESINNYFASFDDNQEIIADIESRIAEIFLSKLNEGKQVITIEDIESLKSTMGSVKDFQAIEEPEMEDEESTTSDKKKQTKPNSRGAKKLYRDSNRKILGGVASGMAHYFGIDPLWVRLLIIILASGSGGLLVFGYFIMWIVVPESEELEEDSNLKKMYRNPEDKVFGGVASGMAAYFGVEAIVIRIAFVLLTFLGGAGLLAYIILWIIVPEAKSITEKVQMEGDPITLSNIESNIKKGLNVSEDDDENVFIKIILFPFRLIGMILSGLGNALGPIFIFLVEVLRIIFGLVIVLTSLSLLLSFVIAVGVLLGIFAGGSLFG